MAALLFIFDFVTTLYVAVVILRLLLPLVRASFHNPLSRAVVQVTDPVVVPLRRILPGFRGIDWATVVFLLLLETSVILIIHGLAAGTLPSALQMLLWVPTRTAVDLLNIYTFAIIIRVLLSWFGAALGPNPLMEIIIPLTEPAMRPFRRLLPPMGGLDLSPILLLVSIQAVKLLILVDGRLLPGWLA